MTSMLVFNRAEKFSAQASAHPLSQAQGGIFCLLTGLTAFVCSVRVLRLNEIQEVLTFALCTAFLFVFVVVVVVFLSLENYFGFRTTNVRVKMDQT